MKKAERKATVFTCGYLVVVVAAVIILLLIAFKQIFPPEPIQPTKAQFVTFMSLRPRGSQTDTPYSVFLISDSEEIDEINILASKARYGNHACGFDYGITFWTDEMTIEKSTDINYDCDSYPRALKEYFTRLKEEPTHYAYFLDLPVQIPPEDAIDDFAALDLLAICASGPYANLPSIAFWKEYYLSDEEGSLDELQVEMNAEINALVDDLALTYPIVNFSIETERKAYNTDSVGRIGKAILYFELGTDLSTISKAIMAAGFDSSEPEIPGTYTIMLLTENSNPDEIMNLIYDHFDYVLDVRW